MHKKLLIKPVYLKLVSSSGRANFFDIVLHLHTVNTVTEMSHYKQKTFLILSKSLAKDEIFFMVTFIFRRILSGNWHGHITRTGLSWWALGVKKAKSYEVCMRVKWPIRPTGKA